jgi:hypothetical protein
MIPMIPAIFENFCMQWANNHHLWQTVAHYTNLGAVTSWGYEVTEGQLVRVSNATFNNISVISWQSVLLVEQTEVSLRKPPTFHKSLTNFIT